ncbi:hypothetical protein [Chitinophaga pinensis]|uniref:BACON domain-containing protein n=1 Tax=Chitinophaga pinensis (strain ATCC 43595 / DSM 2588 / LMG 13176 / NBRC 15968 / NCIMB 11800 / UQM 2034) TaxID=485918 RepID=A0A979G2P4_CHIPD|nr:hypothetical protein [Chitinophaga pinensis]ACU59627.1 hypothetical protein Cpin_2135 [Chitinophaga pinensis DSM 2588]
MKLLKNYAFLALLLSLVFVACSKDDDNKPSSSSHKVYFKAVASTGSSISVAVWGYDGKTTTASSLSGTTWTSPEFEVPAGTIIANAAVSATGVNASSTLKLQVFVDGEMKDEGSSSGEILSASVSHSF